jgi:uncharacterized membrane protein YeaQ/YmgE (transglycosylase-associated protein family)
MEKETANAEGEKNVGLISWIVVGIIAGLLASWILPGPGSGGFTGVSLMILTGMAGASVGGFVFNITGQGCRVKAQDRCLPSF